MMEETPVTFSNYFDHYPIQTCIGFLNKCFPDWYQADADARLPFGYNAQRTLHWFTFENQPGYWNSIDPLKVRLCVFLHFKTIACTSKY
jgi:hypothetical protein